MQKSLLGLVVLVTAGCVAGYTVDTRMQKREAQISQSMDKLKGIFPPALQQRNTITKGILTSDGVYELSYTEGSKSIRLIVNYQLEHGLSSWFGGDMHLHATTKVDGEITKYLQNNPSTTSTIEGNIQEDGSFKMTLQGTPLTFKVNGPDSDKPVLLKLDASTGQFNYDKASGKVHAEVTYPQLNVEEKEKVTLKNISFKRDFNINEPELGTFNFDIAQVSMKDLDAKGIALTSSAVRIKEKYNVAFDFKVANAKAKDEKDIQVEVGYSINGMDKALIDLYKQGYDENWAQNKPSPAKRKEIWGKLEKIVQSGMEINLDKFVVKNSDGGVQMSGSIALASADKPENISFTNNLSAKFNLLIDGKYGKMAMEQIPPQSAQLLGQTDPNKMQISFIYNKDNMKLNDQELPDDEKQLAKMFLDKVDEGFKEAQEKMTGN